MLYNYCIGIVIDWRGAFLPIQKKTNCAAKTQGFVTLCNFPSQYTGTELVVMRLMTLLFHGLLLLSFIRVFLRSIISKRRGMIVVGKRVQQFSRVACA